MKYKLDNEFDLVFVVAYQKILQLSYVDKFLNDIHLAFRDKYKNDLADGRYFQQFDFVDRYNATLHSAEHWGKQQAKAPKSMRTFEESGKSKKTVASMIERKGEEKSNAKKEKKKEVNFVEEGEVSLCESQFEYCKYNSNLITKIHIHTYTCFVNLNCVVCRDMYIYF